MSSPRAVTGERSVASEATDELGERFESFGRAGWVAKGAVYGLIGLLFIRIAWLGGASEEANQEGAVERIAGTGPGGLLLVVLAAGLLLYIVWRLFTVVLPGDWTGRALLDRIGYAVSAAVYTSLLVTVVDILVSDGGSDAESEDRTIERYVKDTLEMPAGRWLVAVAGIVVIGIGVAFVRKGVTRSFRDSISGDHGGERSVIDNLGLVGWVARGVSMFLIGGFLTRAAYLFDADEAAGFDDSIRQIADSTWGSLLAVLVGVGFIAFGVFCIVSARHQELTGPRND